MPVHAIRIEERLWSSVVAAPAGRSGARSRPISSPASRPGHSREPPAPSSPGCDDSDLHFVFTGSALSADTLALARAEVAPLVGEYVDLIRKLSGGDLYPAHIEPIDMAKRVLHDAGARRIGALTPDLSPSFEIAPPLLLRSSSRSSSTRHSARPAPSASA